ncbi:Subtilisin [Actinobacteria bacterium OK074]|nr:Subtilisin [Actinobacteria bacterium OK074]
MRTEVKRAGAAAVATAAAVVLAAGLTTPAQATATATANTAVGTDAGAVKSLAKGAAFSGTHHVTLITGDRVVVGAKGQVVGIERAKGRERVPVRIRKSDGHTLVVPADAERMIATGKLDRRLFDITELNKSATRKAQQGGLKVIVGYKGTASAARADVRDSGTLSRTLKTLNADVVQTSKQETADLWKAVTDGDTTAAGVAHVWFDGIRTASLDKSVPQIGAPAAWARGYTGKGVKVAVLDTGIDTTHPDLKDQVIASKNFTTAKDAIDHFGHGTHVASIVAGTGAKSGGKYKGVAPGAELLNGKVLDDTGSGDDSGILAGMEWAAEQGASIVNLSLGGYDTPETDPLEAEVNKLSEEKGILFAIAAGNDGEYGAGTVGSPGSAADAITVGAVDGNDKLASFSSRGPTADGSLKPDVTAPGVDITAASAKNSVIAKEVGEKPAGYVTISGTSMATPHVAGAAAILKQEHPDWTYLQLKSALTGSAKPGNYTPYEQGSGRIAVDKAIDDTVLADPSTLDFPVQQWPHSDDTPVTKALTYTNSGDKDVTLKVSLTGHDPNGKAAPAGFFTLGADTVTVPAGGKASVDVVVNAKLGGKANGTYSAYVTAAGDGQSVRTAVGVQREIESYNLTLKYVNRAGQATPTHLTDLESFTGTAAGSSYSSQTTDDTTTIRVPKGKYLLDSLSLVDLVAAKGGVDWLVQPELNVTKDTTVTIDLNRTKAADVTVPAAGAKPLSALVQYTYDPVGGSGIGLPSFADIRLAQIGPEIAKGLSQSWFGQWSAGAKAEYDIVSGRTVKKLSGGYTRHYKASEFATLKVGLGTPTAGKTGALGVYGDLPLTGGFNTPVEQKLPGTRTVHVSTGQGAMWSLDFQQYSAKKDADGFPVTEAYYTLGNDQKFTAGKTYAKTFNTAVFGPRVAADYYGIFRYGNEMYAYLPLFSDGQTHAGSSEFSSVKTTLYRNGTKVGSNADPLFGEETFKVPAAQATYKLTTTVTRSTKVAAASRRIDASWTFKSKTAPDGVQLPASVLRFAAPTDLTSSVTAGRNLTFPVQIQGPAKGKNLKSLGVYVSYDGGKKWTKVQVTGGKITVRGPAKGHAVSLRSKITDTKGNSSAVTIYDAYFGK